MDSGAAYIFERVGMVWTQRAYLKAAHIGPGEEITVTIEYQETLAYDAGAFRLRFPMVVAPRYIPGAVLVSGEAGAGWGVNTDQVMDAERVTPPVAHPDD